MADAAVWITGTGTDKKLNFRLPTGGKGDKGDRGDAGLNGSNVLPTDTAIGQAVDTVTSASRAAVEKLRIAPSLSPITEKMEPLRLIMFQAPGEVYATYSRTGEVPTFQKSTDGGANWTTLSTMPAVPNVVAKLRSGTILAIENTATTTQGGSNPRMWRSTNDGVTWVLTTAGLKFPPISAQGVCEGTDGSVMVAEYGNVAPHQYRVMRSTDDGVTWAATFTSDGTEPQGDPGHIHSVTYDTAAAKHVIFVDRPIVEGVSGPRIYTSSNNGATWTLLGEADSINKPNFVAPMYFADYIAWGSDNQINGRVSRIKRTDFYAGAFDKCETVAMLSQKAFYFIFPIRPDVWAITVAGEFIPGAQTGGPGSTMNEVWLVSNNGSLVSGGMESYHNNTHPGNLSGVRASVPHRFFDQLDHAGFLWTNMPIGYPRGYAAIPATQGWEPPSKRLDVRAMPVIPPRVPLTLQKTSMRHDDVIRFLEYIAGQYVSLTSDVAALGSRSEIRFLDDGTMAFVNNGVTVATMATGQFKVPQRIDLATNGIGVRAGSGSPEGVVTAPVGTIYLNWAGSAGTSIYVKESGAAATGWLPVGHASGSTAARPASPLIGKQYVDTTIKKIIWWDGSAWLDAMGTAV